MLDVVFGADDRSELGSCVSFGVDKVEEILCLDTEMIGEAQNVFGTTL